MKTFLILTATLGLSASAAMAECSSYSKVTASLEIDREIQTASIMPPSAEEQADLMKRQSVPQATTEAAK